MEYSILGKVILWALVGIGAYLTKRMYDQEYAENKERIRRDDLKKSFENQQTREDHTLFSEDEFWDWVESASDRAKHSYTNFVNIMGEYIGRLSPDEIVHFDNLLIHLHTKYLTHELMAASQIIFKNEGMWEVLHNAMMMHGPVFFKNAGQNPNLLLNREVTEIDAITLSDYCAKHYLEKTGVLIPAPRQQKLEPSGEPVPNNQLPQKFPGLWEAFM